jgi:hypothetical protein
VRCFRARVRSSRRSASSARQKSVSARHAAAVAGVSSGFMRPAARSKSFRSVEIFAAKLDDSTVSHDAGERHAAVVMLIVADDDFGKLEIHVGLIKSPHHRQRVAAKIVPSRELASRQVPSPLRLKILDGRIVFPS